MLARALTTVLRRTTGAAQRSQALAAAAATTTSSSSRALSSTPPVTETNEYILYPREAPGLDYKLNWSLAGDDITPAGKAWRNAEAGLLKGGKAPSGGDAKLLEAGDSVPFETFDAHLADVKGKLEAGDLYVEDGTSKGSPSFGVRVISDSPAYALAAKGLLEQGKVGWPFAKQVTVYAAAGAKNFAGVSFQGGKAGEVTGATVALGGVPATAIKGALSMVAEAMKKA